MKVVIIGGGIAGLAVGLLLKKNKHEIVVCERSSGMGNRGHGFLMSTDGMSVLTPFFAEAKSPLKKQPVNLFSLKHPNDTETIKIQLEDWFCIKRVDLVEFLSSFLEPTTLRYGRIFSHFIYENNKAIAAVFANGEVEYGDLFIGADGSNSKVREQIIGPVEFTPVEVKEVVGVSRKKTDLSNDYRVFQKIQCKQMPLAFGYIPVTADEVVWFMQYKASYSDGHEGDSPEQLKAFCMTMMDLFPTDVKEVLEANDFANTYVWNTRDFDLLPTFHKENIVLIGDAAHLALPFTSAGTSNAILDAQCIAESIEKHSNFEETFRDYYSQRAENLKSHVEQGRKLKNLFLHPETRNERGFTLPLVSNTSIPKPEKETKPLKLIYFTDPVCSTCWLIQPILRKLKLEYDHCLDLQYHMGGLLPSWKGYDKGEIKNPMDAARHWEDIATQHNIPLDGDIWIEDPLESSFPPSIAFKAAQIQDNDKAITFLRRIKEMLFIGKKNIARWEQIEKAALSCGLDSAVLWKDMQGPGKQLFLDDLELANQHGVTAFPTFFFSMDEEKKFSLKGFQAYEKFEVIIRQLLPAVQKMSYEIDPEELFTRFHNMTEQEVCFLSNLNELECKSKLKDLEEKGLISKLETKNGPVWMANLPKAKLNLKH